MQRRITSHTSPPICTPADLRNASREDRDSRAALAAALESVGFGLVLLARAGYVLFANGMARELMRKGEGLRSCSGRLELPRADLTTKLHSLLSGDAEAEPAGIAIVIERGCRPPLLAHLMPLGCSDGLAAEGREKPSAVLLILDFQHHTVASFEAFSALHGLTDAEARILREILGGKGVVAAAAKLGVSETTARTHMQRVFEKTGTNRQTELLCAFFRTRL
jgi:DNA-binding CsgD family transcriptional regulator